MKKYIKRILDAIKDFFGCLIDGFRYFMILWGMSEE